MIGKLALRSHPLNSVAWSPDGRRLAIVDQDANVQLWDAVTSQFVQELPNPAPPEYPSSLPIRAAFSPDGTRLAVSGEGTLLAIWDMASGQPVAQVDISGTGMVWSPDGTEIALVVDSQPVAGDSQQVVVVDAATGNIRRSTEANAETACFGQAKGVGWSPDRKQIAIGSCGGQVILYDAVTLNKVSTLTYRTGAKLKDAIPYVAYSPDGRSLAAVIPLPDQYILAIWDLPSGQVRTGRLAPNSDALLLPLSSLAWSPNGRFLAVGYGTAETYLGGFIIPGGNIAIFSVRTGQQVALLRGHTDDVDGISFSPDGKKLASASLDGTVLIWDLTWL
jgi:WD40 repeat protein